MKLVEMARRWRPPRVGSSPDAGAAARKAAGAAVASRGHFVVYTCDGERFEVPLPHLKSRVFLELLRLSEDRFGLPGDGPITLPCAAAFMECVLEVLVRRRPVPEEVERALLGYIASGDCCFFDAAAAAAFLQLVADELKGSSSTSRRASHD